MALVQSKHGNDYLTFNEETHRYQLNGNHVPGVTTMIHSGYVTSPALVSWMKSQTAEAMFTALTQPDQTSDQGFYPREALWPISVAKRKEMVKEAKAADKKKSEEAANIGTLTHDFAFYTETENKAQLAETLRLIEAHQDREKILGCIGRFSEWKKTNTDELVASERIVASTMLQAGGKFDRLAKRNGKLIISDFKTAGSMYLDQIIQMAAYAIMIEEWMEMKVEGLEVLRFGKDDAEFQTLLVTKPEEIEKFKEQAVRCRETYEFTKLGSDKRWAWGGKSKSKAEESK